MLRSNPDLHIAATGKHMLTQHKFNASAAFPAELMYLQHRLHNDILSVCTIHHKRTTTGADSIVHSLIGLITKVLFVKHILGTNGKPPSQHNTGHQYQCQHEGDQAFHGVSPLGYRWFDYSI